MVTCVIGLDKEQESDKKSKSSMRPGNSDRQPLLCMHPLRQIRDSGWQIANHVSLKLHAGTDLTPPTFQARKAGTSQPH